MDPRVYYRTRSPVTLHLGVFIETNIWQNMIGYDHSITYKLVLDRLEVLFNEFRHMPDLLGPAPQCRIWTAGQITSKSWPTKAASTQAMQCTAHNYPQWNRMMGVPGCA